MVTSLDVQEYTGENGAWPVGGITYVTYFPALAHEFAVQSAAGELAALKWLDQHGLHSQDAIAAANEDHDRHEVVELLGHDGIHIHWAEVRSRAHGMVNELWPQVTAVARAAVEKGRLGGDEIAQLFTCVIPT
ncbi:hypothetical protein [Streptomyces niveus]